MNASIQPRDEFLAGTPPKPPPALTDVGNGERFAADHALTLRYVTTWGQWIAWMGTHWRIDASAKGKPGAEVMTRAKRTAKRIATEASAADEDAFKAIVKWAMASQNRSRLEAMIALAASEEPFPVDHESLDSDPWLLNTASGTVDLRTGELREHKPGDLITKIAAAEYPNEPGVDGPVWSEFLNTIFDGDHELIAYVRRLMGCALVGEQLEHVLPILYGLGANGKSVFIEAISYALGDYAGPAAPGLFMTTRADRHPTELADLFGKRLVVLNETRDGAKLDEGLVKSISGGDQVKARRMHQDFWSFKPTHMPLLVTNHKPVVTGTDNGIWRRLRLIPFGVTIPPERQDRQLPEKLRREAPAILKWLVEGCVEWRRVGLAEPAAVMAATDGYRNESDVVGQFLDEWGVVSGDAKVKASRLLLTFNEWSKEAGYEPGDAKWLKAEMERRTFVFKKRSDANYFLGIGLRDDDDA